MKSQFGASLVWKNLYSLNASGLQRPSKGMAKAIREIYSEAAESSCWEEFELSASKCSFFLCFFVRGDLIFVLHSYISHVFTFLFLVRDHECCQLSKKKRLLLSFGSGLSRCRHDWSFFCACLISKVCLLNIVFIGMMFCIPWTSLNILR